jgi:[ribosomal protein S5]-alanine N-acetyltransferase
MTTFDLRLETERLALVAFTAELIEALPERSSAQHLIDAAMPDGWPDEELGELLSLYAGWVRADPTVVGFGPWLIIARDQNSVVGSAGFVGKPNDEGSLELGFGVHPAYRNRGYASEAARVLVEWGLDQPGVERVIAKCDRDNLPSVRVLEKLGMVRRGDADGQLLWEIAKAPERR